MKQFKIPYWNRFDFEPVRIEDLPGEEWRRCREYPLYAVSNMERVKRLEREQHRTLYSGVLGRYICMGQYFPEKLMKPKKGKNGYWSVNLMGLDGKQHKPLLSRLVGLEFVENPNPAEFDEAHHKDGNPDNNRPENIEWINHKGNCNDEIHKERIRKSKLGKKRVLTEEWKKNIGKGLKNSEKIGRAVECDGKKYKNAMVAAEALGLNKHTMKNWLYGKNPMPEKYMQMGLKFADE